MSVQRPRRAIAVSKKRGTSSMTRQRILITGGNGFIGANLARDLVAIGHEVHLIVRRSSSLWRLAGLEGNYAAHHADLRDAVGVRRAVDACRPESVFHLAAQGVKHQPAERTAILSGNLLGTANLLEALAPRDYRMLVHVGSALEYGHRSRPLREDDRLEPRGDYAVSKASAALLVQAEAFRGRPVCTVRLFSPYGPWDDSHRLVPSCLACCMRGEAPEVADTRQARDYIHVDDCVALLKRAAEMPATRGEVLHAGTGQRRSVRELVETVLSVCTGGYLHAEFNLESETDHDERPAGGAAGHVVADIEHTTALTGWQPRHTLASGIERTWAWYQANWDQAGSAALAA
jgi:nucleoside-diphosphate-sugar epimerase